MSANKPVTTAPLSPAEVKTLKEKLRNIIWTSDDVLREISRIQKLRIFLPRD